MKLNSLEIKGFSSYRDQASVAIPFGITGIVGTIEDIEGRSNASGKTSLLMSLLFSLYGTGTFDRMEEVWNDKLAPSDEAYVQSNFELVGNNYIVKRGRKGKSSYLDVFENGKKVCEGNTKAQNFLQDLIGMDSKMFLSSVFVAQKDLAAFIETDPGVRKQYMDVVTDLTMWRSATKRTTTLKKESKVAHDALVEEAKEAEKSIVERSALIRSLSCEVENLDRVKKEYDEKAELIARIKDYDVLSKTLKEYTDLRSQLIDDEESYTVRKTELDKTIKDEATKFDKLMNEYSLYNDFDSDVVSAEIVALEEKLETVTQSISELNTEVKGVDTKLSYLSAELDLIDKDTGNLSEGKCNVCKQDVSKEHIEHLLSAVSEQKSKLLSKRMSLEKKKGTIEKNIDKCTGDAASFQEEIKSKTDSLGTFKELSEKIKNEEEKYHDLNKNLVNELKNINIKLSNIQIKMKEYDTKIDEINSQLSESSRDDFATLQQELDALGRTKEDLIRKQGKLQELESSNDNQKNVLADRKNKLKKLHENLYYFEVLGNAFREIPAELFKEAVVDIEEYANEIIRSIYHKFRIKIYEDESKKTRPLMIAFEVDGKYRNYKLLSGGQQSICAIALRMGFNKILSQRSRVSLNFLILDEIFGSLDKHNREEVFRMLNGLTKFFPQILVITHTEEDHIFPNLIKVRMDSRGNSYII